MTRRGWIDNDNIGVMLPGTKSEGARVFGQSIKDSVNDIIPYLKYSVYIYPDVDDGNENFEKWETDAHNFDIRKLLSKGHSRFSKYRSANYKFPTDVTGSVMQLPVQYFSLHNFLVYKIPVWKRSMDIFGAMMGIIFFSPLFLILGAFIKAVSPGPVFFKQERVGYGTKPFILYKFRTMRTDADPEMHKQYLSELINNSANSIFSEKPMNKLEDDPQIIPFGQVLRKSCIDELPQLINVLLGNMSLVGPRPAIAYEVEEYINWHKERFDILPGMTGLWQVSGKNELTFKQMVSLDIRYMKNFSFCFDLKILIRTPFAIIKQLAKKSVSPKLSPKGVEQNA